MAPDNAILRAGQGSRFWENAIVLENHYATTGGDAHRPGIKPSNLTRAQYTWKTERKGRMRDDEQALCTDVAPLIPANGHVILAGRPRL